jgi:SAM-dependent methyltransferase
MDEKADRMELERSPLSGARYKNAQHYIDEGWHREPKRLFVRLADVIESAGVEAGFSVLDIGCATGELIGYLHHRFPGLGLTGIELSPTVAAEARRLVPFANILEGSALAMKGVLDRRFDIVIGCGVMGIFDFGNLKRYVDELIAAVREGGRIYMVEPYNPYGMDLVAAHRKRIGGVPGEWERGNSIFTPETVKELFAGRAKSFQLHAFEVDFDLLRRDDPQRTWTIPFPHNKRQLINGLNLLMDIGILEARL